MRKFTKITLITALVMLVTGGILTAGGILFGASPKAFQDGLEKGARNHSVFNRWLENNWLERLTDWEDYWEEKGEDWVIDWRKETGIRNMDWSDTSQKASIDAEKVKSLYVAAEAGKIRIQSSPDEKIWVLDLDGEGMKGFHEGDFGNLSSDKTLEIENSAGNMIVEFENK